MKNTDKDLILKITKLCLDSTCDTFHPILDFLAHVNSVLIQVYVNGWNEKDDPVRLQAYCQPIGDKTLQHVHDELVKLIEQHEFNYSPEQLQKTEADKKASKIADLKSQLLELENNHDKQ